MMQLTLSALLLTRDNITVNKASAQKSYVSQH